jgi:toxin YoeB
MAKRIVWTDKAQSDRFSIFEYWNNRNKSKQYSKKLNSLINETLTVVSKHPLVGKRTDIENVRAKLLRDYLIVYEETENVIVVLTIWDNRRNPVSLEVKE